MNLKSFDLNLLTSLDALLAEQSVSRAAARMHVGQPAMSSTLARLRTAFGDPLLVRAGRGLRRTGFADSLQEPLARILHDTGLLIERGAPFDPSTSRRTFTVVASDYVAIVLLRRLIERLTESAPAVSVQVAPVDRELTDSVSRGLVDLAIYPAELLPATTSFYTQPILEDDFVCVTDAANVEPGGALTADQLSTLPYLTVSQGLIPSIPDRKLDEAGVRRNVAMATHSFVTAPFMLSGTRMYTVVQRKLAQALMADARFAQFECPVPVGAIHEHMIWSRRGADAAHRWLREQLVETAELVRSG